MKKLILISILAIVTAAQANFNTFIIRNGASGAPAIQTAAGLTEFVINEGGMKAGWGSNDINGSTIGDITQLAITRHDDTTRFSAGSGPAVAPYFNIWVTDGTNYAVVANEPSNPAFQPLFTDNADGSKTYDLSYADLADKRVKVYETAGWNTNSSWIHDLFGSDPLTFADIASLQIAAPSVSYIQNSTAIGSGAPDDLNTNIAYGFNWIFGDTLSNYVTDPVGYIVSDPVAAAAAVVPVPGAIVLGGLGVGLVGWMKRRRTL